jgi:glycosyltransferase involved in cell wall biosynthesis
MIKVVCFGPGPKFKGGLSNYNTSLAKAFDRLEDVEVHIVSWTQQYPAIIPREFIDKSSRTDFMEGTGIRVSYLTNYNNPGSWAKTLRFIKNLQPDIVIFQWAIAVQGIPLGWIARRLKGTPGMEVIFDLHFVTQKEGSRIDGTLTKYGVSPVKTYIAHAYKTVDELKDLFKLRDFHVSENGQREVGKEDHVIKLFHPIYDLFAPDPEFDTQTFKEALGLRKNVFLFFGFIRKYKGLHHTIEAFARVAKERDDVSLLICGESFWNTLSKDKWTTKFKEWTFGLAKRLFLKKDDDERDYNPLALIEELGIQDRVVTKNEFIANEEVHKYFQVSDAVVLYYSFATPSGIESLSYNFKLPILATRVGHFEETVEDGFNGYLADAGDVESMAGQMRRFLDQPLPPENVAKAAEQMTWEVYVDAILAPYRTMD